MFEIGPTICIRSFRYDMMEGIYICIVRGMHSCPLSSFAVAMYFSTLNSHAGSFQKVQKKDQTIYV